MAPIYLNIFWLAAIYLASLTDFPRLVFFIAAPAASVALWYWRKCSLLIAVLCPLVFGLGLLRSDLAAANQAKDALAPWASAKTVQLRGVVDTEPEMRERTTDFVLAVNEVYVDGDWTAVSGRIMVQVSPVSQRVYGESLELQGRLEEPRNFSDFDYRSFLARQGIFYQMSHPQVLAHSPPSDDLLAIIYSLKHRLTGGLEMSLPEPQAAVAEGVALGIRTSLPAELRSAFNNTNTVPILVISGWHVALVAGFLRLLGRRFLGRAALVSFVLIGVAFYTLLVGPQPTVIRAAIMAALLVVGEYAGRPSDTVVSLLFAASAMTAVNPTYLSDVGFQLSFAATLGITLFVPSLQRIFRLLPSWLAESVAVTLAAELSTLPIIAVVFGRFSTMGLLANFLVHPTIPLIMLLSALTAVLALVWMPLAQLVAMADWAVVTYVMRVVEFLGSLSVAVVPLGELAPIFAVPYYTLLAVLLTGRRSETAEIHSGGVLRRTKFVLGGLALLGVLSWAAFFQVTDGSPRVSFLDVGEGDAILIEGPMGQRVLVDGGPSPAKLLDALGRRMPFWQRSLDMVVLTNASEEDIAGLIAVLERYGVGRVIEPLMANQSASFSRWHYVIRRKNIPMIAAAAGQRFDLGSGMGLEVIYPDGRTASKNQNEGAVVLRLSIDGVSFILAGDLDVNSQKELARSQLDLSGFLLKVPNHGARGALDERLLKAVDPSVAVISVGKDNPFHHPAPETLDTLQGIQVLRTDQDGTVEVTVKNGQPYFTVAP